MMSLFEVRGLEVYEVIVWIGTVLYFSPLHFPKP